MMRQCPPTFGSEHDTPCQLYLHGSDNEAGNFQTVLDGRHLQLGPEVVLYSTLRKVSSPCEILHGILVGAEVGFVGSDETVGAGEKDGEVVGL